MLLFRFALSVAVDDYPSTFKEILFFYDMKNLSIDVMSMRLSKLCAFF